MDCYDALGLGMMTSGFEEGKKTQNELSEFVTLLQEELKLARDAERSTELKKSRCQAFLSQQQEYHTNSVNTFTTTCAMCGTRRSSHKRVVSTCGARPTLQQRVVYHPWYMNNAFSNGSLKLTFA
ncbi:hypothetical protein J6590_027219 [Homalodisca vitripennis]|nr:hypothetical protein J6590_027219 [Homalodisca vitripennis]